MPQTPPNAVARIGNGCTGHRFRPNFGDLENRFIQPDVEINDGKRLRFDEALGPWYSVIGFRLNPVNSINPEVKAFWDGIQTRFIQVNRSRSGFGCNQPLTADSAICVEDVDNRLGEWFSKVRDTVLVVRPDRFIAAITTPECLESVLIKLAKQLK